MASVSIAEDRTDRNQTRNRRLALLSLAIFAFTVRIATSIYFGLSDAPAPGTDSAEYDQYAWNLIQGRGYRGESPDVSDPDHLTAYRPPGVSLVWAALFGLVGHRYDVIRVFHCALGAGSCVLLWQIGRKCFGERSGWIAALIWAVFPSAVYFSTELLSEALTLVLLLLFTYAALKFAEKPDYHRAMVSGFVLGFLLLVNASKVLMLPAIVIWGAWQLRSRWRDLFAAALIPLTAIAVLVPWTVRNYVTFGEVIPLSTAGGSALLQGNNRLVVTRPELYGYNVWDTKIPEYRDSLRAADNEFERDQIAKRYAVEWLRNNPDRWLFLAWSKLKRGLTPFLQPHSPAVFRWGTLLGWGPVLLLSTIAFVPTMWIFLRQNHPGWLVHVTIFHYFALTVLFFGYARYRFPVEPFFLLLAVWLVVWCTGEMRRRFNST